MVYCESVSSPPNAIPYLVSDYAENYYLRTTGRLRRCYDTDSGLTKMIKSKIIDAYKDWFANIPEFQTDFAVTISTTTRDTISGETGLRYFHNRLTRYVNKGIPKYNQVTPKIVGFSELHADKTVHYHLSIDTGRKFKSAERFENAVAKILPECRFLKSNDFHVKGRYSNGWDRYISKFGTAAGEDKTPVIFT